LGNVFVLSQQNLKHTQFIELEERPRGAGLIVTKTMPSKTVDISRAETKDPTTGTLGTLITAEGIELDVAYREQIVQKGKKIDRLWGLLT